MMLKIPRNASVTISLILSVVLLFALIAGFVLAPKLVQILIDTPDNIGDRNSIGSAGRVFILCVTYAILLLICAADLLLVKILLNVRTGIVFTDGTVAFIRYVSWCCILVGALFFSIGGYFQLAIIAGFAAVFGGFCIRAVKNVFEEAVAIKNENDLMI